MDKLCQLGETSCGGCCGIDVNDQSRSELVEIFKFRTRIFKKVLAGEISFDEYIEQVGQVEDAVLEEEDRAHEKRCYLLGFIDEGEKKIGCFGHPDRNNGTDLRSKGYFMSSELCSVFKCDTFTIFISFNPWQRRLFEYIISNIGWYEMSNSNYLLPLIKRFQESLPLIEKSVNKDMKPSEIRKIVCSKFMRTVYERVKP